MRRFSSCLDLKALRVSSIAAIRFGHLRAALYNRAQDLTVAVHLAFQVGQTLLE